MEKNIESRMDYELENPGSVKTLKHFRLLFDIFSEKGLGYVFSFDKEVSDLRASSSLEKQVNQALDDLEEFCSRIEIQLKSLNKDRIASEPFKRLSSMGEDALPYIYRRFKDTGLDYKSCIVLVPLVNNIVGNRLSIPQDMLGKVEEMIDYTMKWLEERGYS